jgi:hypothetical protein
MHWSDIPADSLAVLRKGAVIPAHLLALDENRRLDVRRQRAMTRYYLDAAPAAWRWACIRRSLRSARSASSSLC